MQTKSMVWTALFCLVLAPTLWGGNFVVGSFVAAELHGIWANLLRWCAALLVLLPICGPTAWRHRRDLHLGWRRLTILGLLGVAGFNSVLYSALHHASVTAAAIAFAVTPFFIIGLSSVLDRQWPRRRMLVASAVAMMGVALAQANALLSDISVLGVVLVLLAALTWAAYCVAMKRLPVNAPASATFLAQVLLGTLLLVPLALAFPAPQLIDVSAETWLSIGYLGLGAGALAFWLWQRAIAAVGPVSASPFMNLVPITSLFFGALFLGEQVLPVDWLAFAIVLIGIALSLTGRTPTVTATEALPVQPFEEFRRAHKRAPKPTTVQAPEKETAPERAAPEPVAEVA
ncbi:MAG: DMT family transporter [Pseudomonadota bacterium]